MKLYFSPASPYTRKVQVCAIETGLSDHIQLLPQTVTPIQPSSDLNRDNPLGKLPTLVLEDGTALYDSRVICEYLDSLHGGGLLFPTGAERWQALRYQALADGIMDAGVGLRYETFLRPEAQRWPEWIEQQWQKCLRACDQLDRDTEHLAKTFHIGSLSVVCALGYLDFRLPNRPWREGRETLAAWYQTMAERESLVQTKPH